MAFANTAFTAAFSIYFNLCDSGNSRLEYPERTIPMNVIGVLEESPFCHCTELIAPAEIVRCTSTIRIKAGQIIITNGHVYGDFVYCDDYCKSICLKCALYCVENFNEIN